MTSLLVTTSGDGGPSGTKAQILACCHRYSRQAWAEKLLSMSVSPEHCRCPWALLGTPSLHRVLGEELIPSTLKRSEDHAFHSRRKWALLPPLGQAPRCQHESVKEGLTPCPTGPVSVLGAENESGCRVGEPGGWLVRVLCDRLVPYSHAVKVQADTRFFHSNWDEIH